MLSYFLNGQRPLASRWGAATAVVFLAGLGLSVWIDNDAAGGDYWGVSIMQLGAISLAGIVAGCIVRRWRAIFLALLPIVFAIPFGLEAPDSVDPYFYSRESVVYLMVVPALVCAASIAAGVIAAAAIEFMRHGRSASAPT